MNSENSRPTGKQRLQKFTPLIFFVGAFLLLNNWPRIELWFNPIDSSGVAAGDVVMYGTSWCGYCASARSFLHQAGVPFTEYDIEKSPRARREYDRIGGRGVPVFTVGKVVIQGYDPTLIRRALDKLQQQKSGLAPSR